MLGSGALTKLIRGLHRVEGDFYRGAVRPMLFGMDAEGAHDRICAIAEQVQRSRLALAALRSHYGVADDRLTTDVAGLDLGVVGLAAGFDKKGKLPHFFASIGFDHVEIGTFTGERQEGNERPRMFRLTEDYALINRMGFNNAGRDGAYAQLADLGRVAVPLGVNIGKSKATPLDEAARDYQVTAQKLFPYADYLVINLSSPNTPGLRELQGKEQSMEILAAVHEVNYDGKPIFVKLSPDLTFEALDDALTVTELPYVSGIIATNTTVNRDGLHSSHASQQGGLSGAPLRERALEVVSHIYRQTEGQVPIIGVGGISTAHHAYEMIQAGASTTQLFTGMIYRGPSVARDIKEGLLDLMERDGVDSVKELVGVGNGRT